MIKLNPQYIKDASGEQLVILYQKEFDKLIEALEDLDDIRLYDDAKKKDTGERILMEEAFDIIETKRKKSKEI